tara:strand:+ start:72 stop:536 length:465 start_codon:yes stop_codon:yes gene_type:complete
MKHFIKFFEIGKIDKGLFRIWIVLTIIYSVFAAISFYESTEYNNYSRIKNFNSDTAKTLYCKKQSRHMGFSGFVKTEWYGLSEWMSNFSSNSNPMDIGISKTFEKCFVTYSDLKIKFYNNYITLILYLILIPFIIAFAYLLVKKTFLWIYRGFK